MGPGGTWGVSGVPGGSWWSQQVLVVPKGVSGELWGDLLVAGGDLMVLKGVSGVPRGSWGDPELLGGPMGLWGCGGGAGDTGRCWGDPRGSWWDSRGCGDSPGWGREVHGGVLGCLVAPQGVLGQSWWVWGTLGVGECPGGTQGCWGGRGSPPPPLSPAGSGAAAGGSGAGGRPRGGAGGLQPGGG